MYKLAEIFSIFLRSDRARNFCKLALPLLAASTLLIGWAGRIGLPDERAIEDLFRPFAVPQTEAKATQDLDVYVDGSMSMRGYASAEGSNYSRIIRELLQSAITAQFNLNVYKFTSTVTPVTNLQLSQFQSPDFYNGRDTPLAALLSRLATSPTHTVIIVSDLVQSEGGVDSLGLVRSLTNLADKRPQMKLMAYRSSFIGEYYPENRARAKHGTIRLNAQQSLPGSGRPFYLLAIAPNAESMKRVDDYILTRLPAVQTLSPTAPPMVVEGPDILVDAPKELREMWSLYARPMQKETPIVRRIDSAFRLQRPTTDGIVIL